MRSIRTAINSVFARGTTTKFNFSAKKSNEEAPKRTFTLTFKYVDDFYYKRSKSFAITYSILNPDSICLINIKSISTLQGAAHEIDN